MQQTTSILRSATHAAPAYKTPDHMLEVDVTARFGKRLRTLREQRRLTQTCMATKFGLDRSFISDVERGKKAASIATLEVLALGFKITLSDLFRGI